MRAPNPDIQNGSFHGKAVEMTMIEYEMATSIPAEFSEACTYSQPLDGRSFIPMDCDSALKNPVPTDRRTETFQGLAPGPVTLRGFRTYITEDQKLFLDESLSSIWERDRYFARFAHGKKFEDLTLTWDGERAHLPVEENVTVIDEPVYALCSGEPSNYGSWIYRVLPKLATLPTAKRKLFLYLNSDWQREMLAYFAPDFESLRHQPLRAYLLRDALIPTPRNVGVLFDDRTREFYRRHALAVPGKSPHRKIYLTRASQKIRPMINEAELQETLKDIGFDMIAPEQFGIEDRMRIIRDAEGIVCPGGSGLFNLVFAQNAKFVLDIEASRTWIYAHSRIMQSLELPHTVLFGKQHGAGLPHDPWLAPIPDIEHCLKTLA